MKKVKVLIIDDAKTIQQVLTHVLSTDPELEVVGCADNPNMARELIKKLNPDVLTLDIEMPEMDGLTFLKNLMRLRPMPVVMCSTLTGTGKKATIKALELGAIDYISKPSDPSRLEQGKDEIITKVKYAAGAKINTYDADFGTSSQYATLRKQIADVSNHVLKNTVVVIGASTGGVLALTHLMQLVPKQFPPIVLAQHITEDFSKIFVERISTVVDSPVGIAEDKTALQPGTITVAPGGKQIDIVKEGTTCICRICEEVEKYNYSPSIDRFFTSVASLRSINVIACILTGMGEDGAQGLLQIKEAGGFTIAQDEESSVVWGMPGSAVRLGAANKVLPLNHIIDEVISQICILDKRNAI